MTDAPDEATIARNKAEWARWRDYFRKKALTTKRVMKAAGKTSAEWRHYMTTVLVPDLKRVLLEAGHSEESAMAQLFGYGVVDRRMRITPEYGGDPAPEPKKKRRK